MSCLRCKSERILGVSSKSNDLNTFSLNGVTPDQTGYVIEDAGIGGGDYIRFKVCLDCGQMQGKYPVPELTFGVGTRTEFTESELLAQTDLDT